MAAGKYSFVIEQGATTNFEIAYKDSSGNPVNLTNYSGRMQIASDYASNASRSIYITLSSSLNADGTGLNFSGSNGINPPTSGTIGVYISSNTSSLFAFSTAKYDLEIYSGSTSPFTLRLLEGQVSISNQVTT
jgi:hypothetical protein